MFDAGVERNCPEVAGVSATTGKQRRCVSLCGFLLEPTVKQRFHIVVVVCSTKWTCNVFQYLIGLAGAH